MKKLFQSGLVLTALGLLVSCGQPSSESQSLSANIINGKVTAPGEWTNVVALVSKRDGSKFCSGTVIAPTMIYSAAHCIITSDDVLDVLKNLEDKINGLATPTEKRDYISFIVKFLFKRTVDDLAIEVDGQVSDVVASVKIDAEWESYLSIAAFVKYNLASEAEKSFNSLNMRDRSEITLKSELAVSIVPKISAAEWNEIIKDPYLRYAVTFVGYGFTKTQSEQTAEELDRNSFFGVKHVVETKLTHISKDGFTVYAGVNGQSACQGDSGGAAFIKLPKGQLRFFASITAVARIKCGADIASRLNGSLGNLTLGSTKVDLRVDNL